MINFSDLQHYMWLDLQKPGMFLEFLITEYSHPPMSITFRVTLLQSSNDKNQLVYSKINYRCL